MTFITINQDALEIATRGENQATAFNKLISKREGKGKHSYKR